MTQKYQVKVSMKQASIVETGIVLKQGDFGMQIEIEVLDFDATGTTPQIVFRKAMGAVESTTITVSGNKYTYTFKGTELDTPGKCFCDLKLKNSTTQRISTASFMFKVVADTLDGLAEESSSYSDTIEQLLQNTIQKSDTSGLMKNDGSVDTNSYALSSAVSTLSNTVSSINNELTKTNGALGPYTMFSYNGYESVEFSCTAGKTYAVKILTGDMLLFTRETASGSNIDKIFGTRATDGATAIFTASQNTSYLRIGAYELSTFIIGEADAAILHSYYNDRRIDNADSNITDIQGSLTSIKNMLDLQYEVQPVEWTSGGYYRYNRNYTASGAFVESETAAYSIINVYKGEKYIIQGVAYYDINPCVIYNSAGTKKAAYPNASEAASLTKQTFEILEDGFMSLNAYIATSGTGMSGYPTLYKAVSYKPKDKFNNKTILFTGDSITNGYGWDAGASASNRKSLCLTHPENTSYWNLGWAQTFAEDHRGATIKGYGVNGTRISLTDGNDSITERIDVMAADADYIILSGGINDCFNQVPLGEMVAMTAGNNAWKSASFDTATFCGALETLIRKAYTKWPTAKIGYIITGKNTNMMKAALYSISQEEYIAAMIQILNKWDIPYLDLYHNDGLCTAFDNTQTTWFSNDQTHPNEMGYRVKLRYLVEDFMQKL